jgi:hypothetical protein
MLVEQDLAAPLRRQDLEGLFRFRHREFVGGDDVHICWTSLLRSVMNIFLLYLHKKSDLLTCP